MAPLPSAAHLSLALSPGRATRPQLAHLAWCWVQAGLSPTAILGEDLSTCSWPSVWVEAGDICRSFQ